MENYIHGCPNTINRDELLTLLAVSRGDAVADYIIENVTLLDLVNGGEIAGPIVIKGRWIAGIGEAYEDAPARQRIDAQHAVAVPGFIDAHLHIESSMMTPVTFETATLPLGLTTLVCDPHEIVNVMGESGLAWFLRCAEQSHQNQYVQISSCVPALAGSDVNGADFPLEQMLRYRHHPLVAGIGEVMDFPATIAGSSALLDKLDAFRHLTLDGHSPMLSGKALNAYIAAGIENCHESHTLAEGREKLALGMALMIREGSAAHNLDALAPLITDFSSPQCLLCTDDRNPWEIAHEGHIDALIRRLIQHHHIAPHLAYRVASWSTARHYGFKHLGLLAPGKQADIVLLSDVEAVKIQQVWVKGKPVDERLLQQEEAQRLQATTPPLANTVRRKPVQAEDFKFTFVSGKHYRVMELIPGELITRAGVCLRTESGFDREDICFLAVLDRYGHELPPALGLISGFSLENGALAATVSHDSHNIVVMGRDTKEMAIAVNQVIHDGGGLCVVQHQQVVSHLPLPIAGLMSSEPADVLAQEIDALKAACRRCGIPLNEPFIQMAFLSLPVIPSLKLTSKGLFDVDTFTFTPLEVAH
ncbi:adenine deaminase [Yokenella regensburgei]|uniref:adenine deaminase n=1 Tax=Yokenella regensburgei TaxID=158877 RepID=UPI0014332838|nr:adenine deaminase [Yokenella regensburgei]QIU88057.1 adenine deaminase [Yokenella regensburgei]